MIHYTKNTAHIVLEEKTLTPTLMQTLEKAILNCSNNHNIKCICISGGKDFSFGADINFLHSNIGNKNFLDDAWLSPLSSTKPIIIIVNGLCLGGGLELALMGDIIICAPDAKFGLVEANLGIMPGLGGCQLLAGRVGYNQAIQMILQRSVINAQRALDIGLVNEIHSVPIERAEEIAVSIGTVPIESVLSIKRALQPARDMNIKQEQYLFYKLFNTHNADEGLKAFIEKRPPKYY